MSAGHEGLRRLIGSEEGQYFDRKSLLEGPSGSKRARDRRTVRDQIAEYVAAFANADGGTLVLGVEDNGTLSGCPWDAEEVEKCLRVPELRLSPPLPCGRRVDLEGQCLLVFEVVATPRAVKVIGDGYPRREGDQVFQVSEEFINRLKEGGLIRSPEARIAARASLSDLDLALVQRAMAATGFDGDAAAFLIQRRLADWNGDVLALRQGAVWLFAKSPAVVEHPNIGLRVFRVHGTQQRGGTERNVQDFPWIEGGLLGVLTESYRLIGTLIRSSARLHDLFFRETPEYPTFAWQEALVNALAHRDYSVEGRCVEVWIYEDRIEVHSPGGLLPEVEVEALLSRKRIHASRNPRMARVLTELGLMRQQGEGIPRMIEEMELSWLRPPELHAEAHEFVVTLRNEPIFQGADAGFTAKVRELPLDVRQKRALVAFHDREFQSADYQQLNRIDRDLAYRELSELVERRYVTVSGERRGTRYRVRKDTALRTSEARTPMLRLLRRMDEAGRIANEDYREIFGISRPDAARALGRLCEEGVLLLQGERRGAHYVPGPAWPPAEE